LPGQTVQSWRESLAQATALRPEHLSLYQLTLEPQTVFAKYPPVLPPEDTIEAMEEVIAQQVEQSGWARYEISAYSQPNKQSRHNLNYWTFGDYLGVGPGAHSKLSFHDRIVRQARTRNPTQWMSHALARDGSHITEQRLLQADDLVFEFFLNALRLIDGVPASLFNDHTGLSQRRINNLLVLAKDRGLLDLAFGRIRATAFGLRHLNDLQALFLSASA
jgi:coproporphyrinogen III oxidase-like Fe-S oxidoreductase